MCGCGGYKVNGVTGGMMYGNVTPLVPCMTVVGLCAVQIQIEVHLGIRTLSVHERTGSYYSVPVYALNVLYQLQLAAN